MRVISLKTLKLFWQRYPDAERPLRKWYKVALAAKWGSIVDVRATYPHTDAVVVKDGSTLTVFNIAGNKYRLVVRIRYEARWRLVNVRGVFTHAEYDAGKWKA